MRKKREKRKRKITGILLAAALLCMVPSGRLQAYAKTPAEIQESINEKKSELGISEKEEETLEREIERKTEEAAQLYAEVETLNIEKQGYYDGMSERIRYFYENSRGGILEVLLESGSTADFISRLRYVKALSDYDSVQMDEYTELIAELDGKTAELEKEMEELADLVEEERDRQIELEESISEEEKELEKAKEAEKRESSGNAQYAMSNSGGALTKRKGVVYYNGHRETYYSQRVLPGGGLNIPGRHVASDGTVRDADNYICVASSDLAKGTVVETSLGTGKVYDSGCASGTIDIYTDW